MTLSKIVVIASLITFTSLSFSYFDFKKGDFFFDFEKLISEMMTLKYYK